MILTIRTDIPIVYLGIWDGSKEIASHSWEAGRELSVQLLQAVEKICTDYDEKAIADLKGIVIYKGPGSYTGLRIGVSTANAIGSSYNTPVVGTNGDNWILDGLKQLENLTTFSPISPDYGGEVHTTTPRK